MTTIQELIAEFNESARKTFGHDVNVMVARAPSFGHDDVCLIVRGHRRMEVACNLLRFVSGGRISETSSEFMGVRTLSAVIEGLAI